MKQLLFFIEKLQKSGMFLKRSDKRLKTGRVGNQFATGEHSQEFHHHDLNPYHQDIELINYPVLSYIFGAILIGLSIYLIYSVTGGANSIKGFNNNLWWQYIISLLPFGFGLGFMLFCQIQTLLLSRKNNFIHYTKTRMFCFVTDEQHKQFSDLIGLSLTRTGTERNNISMVSYHLVLSFSTCEEMQVLTCAYSSKVVEYFEEVRRYFGKEEISQKKIVIQNFVD